DRLVAVALTLGTPSICGDGVVRAPRERCDDGVLGADDGCDDDCQVDTGFVCGGEPSQCLSDGVAALVDAASCGDVKNGTYDAPYCTIAEGVAGGMTTVFVGAGTYDEVAIT